MNERIKKLGAEIEVSGLHEFTALQLRKFMYDAQIGLDRRTVEKYLQEGYFSGLIAPRAFSTGKRHEQLSRSVMSNVSIWKRGPSFDDIMGNGESHESTTARASVRES